MEMYNLENAAQNLEALQLELPDFDQSLFPQPLIKPNSFTYFSQLLPELRQMVWEKAMPGRRIIDYGPQPNQKRAKKWYRRRHELNIPIIFHINSESRDVARRHYVDRRTVEPWKADRTEIFLNPTVDQICIGYGQLFYGKPNPHRKAPRFQASPLMDNISSLEVRDIGRREINWSLFLNTTMLAATPTLCAFRGLRHLHLIARKGFDFSDQHLETEDFVNLVQVLINRSAAARKSRVVPEVILHDWRPCKPRSDHDHLHEAAIPYPWNGKLPEALTTAAVGEPVNSTAS
ncbi:hypothetical protein LZ554_006662 [Drepanopeziza brunnea f. sp. 'monogermtubi']|nr:hypothetical protein LZ554_006662 [Drepanopeziza brunnea f. sp. 'monogermtubi']